MSRDTNEDAQDFLHRRVNQARDRDKQRRHRTELEQAIDALKEQVCKLEAGDQTVWNVAATMSVMMDDAGEKIDQMEFLQRAMAADVADGVLLGLEAIVEH